MKAWLSAAEIAALALPEMPASRRGVARLAEAQKWDRGEMARERQGRGGGLEYHVSLLPAAAQAVLTLRQGPRQTAARAPLVQDNQTPAAQAQDARQMMAWTWFEQQPQAMRQRASARLEALIAVETLRRRIGRGAAIKQIAEENDVSVATLHNWLERVRGVPRADWLPALVPQPRGGGGRDVDVSEPFWEAFKADYLRPARPSVTSCFRRIERIAAREGWEVPNLRTLRRRVANIPPAVLTMAREGRDATKALFPAQERDRSGFHAMEAVNADGHKWDVFVRWEDGTVSRPLMVAFQDLYSGLFLAWRIARSENKDAVRLCFGAMIEAYGVPDHCWLDNGRAFASKWLTGGTKNRYRFKVRPEEPLGILTQLGVQVHWTTPYAGQSKPIERGFGDFARDIAKHPAFQGAYCGNAPDAKPEDYGTRAVPIDVFKEIVDSEIAEHNARPGRQSRVCGGKLSFAQAFEASYAAALIRKATAEQRRMCMLAAEGVRPRRQDGAIILMGNRYWHEKLLDARGRNVTVRFDPEQLHADLPVYAQDGTLICVAALVEAAGFADTDAARKHAAARNTFVRANREALAAERRMSVAELAALLPKTGAMQPPEPKILRPMFTGNLAMKAAPAQAAANEEDKDEFYENMSRGLRLVRDAQKDF